MALHGVGIYEMTGWKIDGYQIMNTKVEEGVGRKFRSPHQSIFNLYNMNEHALIQSYK